uniref:Condensation domain-containing protein n=1 Tax=Globisporangium ultimum (strain ATCC 200006 / CBS 805.95 / DAOM BR144) TaxID=431595 RepID=K3X2M0_GLOUD
MAAPKSRMTVPLRGYERFMTLASDGSVKIAHIMILRSDSGEALPAFLEGIPTAVLRAFNKHPRMRAKQLRDEFAMAEIHAPITMEALQTQHLLEIQECKHGGDNWAQFVEKECNTPFDRYAMFPYYVRIWHVPSKHYVRLMLFSDHCMSDGTSGMIVLNDIVTLASALSRHSPNQQEEMGSFVGQDERPVSPPLYELWRESLGWWRRFSSTQLVKLFGKMSYQSDLCRFTPVIPLRADQGDFKIPPNINSSSALFAQGTPGNMQKTLARCKEESVTFFGAVISGVVIAYYLAAERGHEDRESLFKLTTEFDVNMRKRIECPTLEGEVGAYMATNAIERISKEGVHMNTVTFWDFARQAKQDVEELVGSLVMPFPMLFLDENVHERAKPEFFDDLPVPQSISSDVNISSLGKYPYEMVHSVQTAALRPVDVVVDSVHVYNSMPHLTAAAIVYIASTDKFSFSLMHKYEHDAAQQLFDAFTTSIEHAGAIATKDTMANVATRVRQILESKQSRTAISKSPRFG